MLQQRLDLELAAVPLGVPAARGAVTRLCRELRIKDGFADDVRQAVTEACINFVVRDCHEAPRDRTFLLKVAVTDESLLVVVQGAGGYRGALAGARRPATDRSVCGRGRRVAAARRPDATRHAIRDVAALGRCAAAQGGLTKQFTRNG